MQTRSHKPTVFYCLENARNLPLPSSSSSSSPASTPPESPPPSPPPPFPLDSDDENAMTSTTNLPPPFTGKSDVNPTDWLSEMRRYCDFKAFENDRRCQLHKYLLRQAAADWLEAQPPETVDTLDHFLASFRARFEPNQLTKYKSAQELFQRRQQHDETAEDFVAAVKKIGRRIDADDQLLRYAVINGLRPDISAHVIRQQPETLADVITAARVAEITAPPTTSGLERIEDELRRLSSKLDKTTTAAVSPRASPTPFTRPITPPARQQHQQQQQSYQSRQDRGRRVSFGPTTRDQRPRDLWRQQRQSTSPLCSRCGYEHNFSNYCGALDPRNRCRYCLKRGHFQSQCYAAQRDGQSQH